MKTTINLFLDDQRNCPIWTGWADDFTEDNWVLFRHIETAKSACDIFNVDVMSLDNDMAQEESGYDFLKWYLNNGLNCDRYPRVLKIHTGNIVAREQMYSFANSFKRHWELTDEQFTIRVETRW